MSKPDGQVSLRGLVLSDASAMARWAGDPEFCRTAGWSRDLAPDEHLKFQRNVVLWSPPELLRLGVEFSGVLVGYLDLHGTEPGRRELGFLIGERRLWGRGLGRRAAAAGLEHGFGHPGLHEIWAEAVEANVRSTAIFTLWGSPRMARVRRKTSWGLPACIGGSRCRPRTGPLVAGAPGLPMMDEPNHLLKAVQK